MAALLIIDMQLDFCKGGALGIDDGAEAIPFINQLRRARHYDMVVITQDWHPPHHCSFASRYNREPFTPYGEHDYLWPDHCVRDTPGAQLHPDLVVEETDVHIRKGTKVDLDAYSCFGGTGLAQLLREHGIKTCDIVGLAFDFCVRYSAIDARREGFEVRVFREGSRPVDKGAVDLVIKELTELGVKVE